MRLLLALSFFTPVDPLRAARRLDGEVPPSSHETKCDGAGSSHLPCPSVLHGLPTFLPWASSCLHPWCPLLLFLTHVLLCSWHPHRQPVPPSIKRPLLPATHTAPHSPINAQVVTGMDAPSTSIQLQISGQARATEKVARGLCKSA